MNFNRKIDIIIPAYNVEDKILFRCLSSIACQEIIEDLEVTIVDDASTLQNYEEVAENFSSLLKINVLRYEINGGPGVARQYGIDHTNNEYIVFIDADDTFNGAFALKNLRIGIEMQNGLYQMCVGVFDEILEKNANNQLTLIPHNNDMIWMFGKIYRRSFINKYNIRFHPTSRANEDNGFNTICRLCSNEWEQINFISNHVYYWHENLNSITRINNNQYSYGSSETDSFFGYVENMKYAIQEAKKRKKNDEVIIAWTVTCMIQFYEYYIECCINAPEHADNNFKYCQDYYHNVYKPIAENISKEFFTQQYNEVMRSSYLNNKLNNIIPPIGIFDFFNLLEQNN